MKFHTKRILFSLFILTFSITIKSQNQTSLTDSLTQKSFQELSDLFYSNKSDTLKALTYAKALFLKALKEKDTMKMVDGKYLIADIKGNENIYLNFCDSLINIYKKNPTKKFPATIYYGKGRYYFQKSQIDKSLNEYLNAIKFLKITKNDSLFYLSNMHIGLLKSKLKKNKEAIKLYKKAYFFALKNNYFKANSDYYSLLLNIPILYNKLNQLDSANLYCKKAEYIYSKNKDSLYIGSVNYVRGLINKNQGNYLKSIIYFKKTIPYHIDDENYLMLLYDYSLIAKCYEKINKNKLALKYYLKVDSLQDKLKIFPSNLIQSYNFLKNYYNNDLKKQLFYINKLIYVSEKKHKETTKTRKVLTEKYDIPNLLAEKKKIISKLEVEAKNSKRNKLIYITLLFISIILIVYQINKKRIYKKRFLALINQEEKGSQKVVKEVKPSNTKLSLPDAVIKDILNKLILFEKNNDFLHSDINLQNLATKFNTNSNYLSKVINQHKNLTFTNYINNLRIEYTVQKLKTDSLLRKYTIKAIATEVGFKNSESFSKAFFKYTGIKPSYFIKELNK